MLTSLYIQDFVLIDQARLTVSTGLTALTGETGAGKSILLDALGLAVGARAERGAVRQGASQGTVSATFEPAADHPVWAMLADNGLDTGDDQIILRRVLSAEGRGRGFVNDQPVSVGMLRQVGEALLEIHGQHDGRGFLSASAHRGLLDEFAGLQSRVAKIGDIFRDWRDAQAALDERRQEQAAALREADYLRHVVEQLEKLGPQPEEESALAARRAELMAAEKVSADLKAALDAVDDGDVDGKLSVALRSLERAAARLPEGAEILDQASARLDAATSELMEARAAMEAAYERFGADPQELDAVEERLFALRAEARKHGVTPDALSAFLEKARGSLQNLDAGEAAFAALEAEVAENAAAYDVAAADLSKKRRAAAKKLDKAVANELAPLKLGRAHFETSIKSDPDHPTASGVDVVEFMVATNPGAPAGPLKSIASGGDLSRFVLAMKAALAAKENRTVIIFDEVDAGVGGAVADAVGERLARLAAEAQVMVVTHSPQVAARADSHWRIEKKQTKSSTKTGMTELDADGRIEEIARMLSGAAVTDEARAAARRLLGKPAAKAKPTKRKLAKAG